ncbi:DUF6236 family protein [Bordetella bronchiseptica]|uniref:DUF6236 family protein n=1 Tax=Bordetella bronchiseptica TaxID=518 RepID=UPI001245C8DA|nr:DUF6236 family protein [Bordetella bronchiseptica]KAB1448547.1 hypothetical protein F7D00_08425 [Bordetella bronchiseptica]KAB1574869.1 hypothetical protein F7890_08425 [Bordetella bronchiseptica]
MSNNALYFPNISVPGSAWTAQAVLYWDKLASIVPLDHLDNPEHLSPNTRALMVEGLVEPVMPGRYLYQIPEFDKRFIRYIEDKMDRWRRSPMRFSSVRRTARVHAEKLGEIPDFLVNAGLARRLEWPWYDIEEPVAGYFMTYLATVLCALPQVGATPITDKLMLAQPLGLSPTIARGDRTLHTTKARHVILKALLPVPAGPLNIHKLVAFKQRHGHLLPQLRAKIELHCTRIAAFESPDQRRLETEAFIADSQEQIDEITAAMELSFTRIALGKISPLFGAGLTLGYGTDLTNPGAAIGGALTLAGTIYEAVSSIRARQPLDAKPLAYFAYGRRELAPARIFNESAPG